MRQMLVNLLGEAEMKLLSVIFMWLLYVWLGSYTFKIWPWDADVYQWWYIPHVITLGFGLMLVTILGTVILESK
jgi:hypothetical protein